MRTSLGLLRSSQYGWVDDAWEDEKVVEEEEEEENTTTAQQGWLGMYGAYTHIYIYICSNLYLLVLLLSWFLLLSLYFISIIIHSVKTKNTWVFVYFHFFSQRNQWYTGGAEPRSPPDRQTDTVPPAIPNRKLYGDVILLNCKYRNSSMLMDDGLLIVLESGLQCAIYMKTLWNQLVIFVLYILIIRTYEYICMLCTQRLYRSNSCGSKTHVGVVVLALLFRVRLETVEVFGYRDASRFRDVFGLPKCQAFLGPGVGSVAASAWPSCFIAD